MKTAASQGIFERLYAIGKRLTSSLDTEEVLHSILECAIQEVDGELGWISLVEGEDELVLATSYGVEAEKLPQRISFRDGITGMVAQTGTLYYSEDVHEEERFIKVNDEIRSEVAVPLLGRDKVLGVFNIESKQVSAFSEEDLQLVAALAEQAAIAVENAAEYGKLDAALRRSVVGLEQRIKALQVLSDVTSVITSSLDLDEVLATIIAKVRELTDGAECQLLIRDARTGAFTIHTSFELESGLKEGDQVSPEEGITGWVVRHEKTLNIPDVTRDRRYRCWIPDTQSELALPLMQEGRLIGVLNLESSRRNAFSRECVEILEMLAAHAAGAVLNAELFRKYKRTRELLDFSNYMASMGEFTADLIHWFGNKAGLIMGCAESIRAEAGTNPSVAEDLDIIVKHMSEVQETKQRILGEAGTEAAAEHDLCGLIREVLESFAGQPVSAPALPGELAGTARPAALKKVISTVIENSLDALKDTPDARVEISARAEGRRAAISIRDNGPGFPREKLATLFRPFFSTKKQAQGSGMGLWLCYRAMKAMHGEIIVDGDTGKGLTFTLWLEQQNG